jgi:signal transduction histidine kinase/DNA-binding NarL/FixJ family response regulator
MLSVSPSQVRLGAVTSLRGRLPARLHGVAGSGLWPVLCIVAIAAVTLLVFWLTGQLWLALAAGFAGMALAAWRTAGVLAAARDAVERTERARAAMEQALRRSQQMEMLGRLSVGAAHDFNNHLTVISSNVEMVARRLDRTQERLSRHTEAAMQAVQRAAALTGLLLSFARQPAPRPEPEVVDVDRLLRGMADLLRRTLGERIGLDVVASDTPWFTWADTTQMETALLSLVVNTRDQVRNGARLTITVSNVRRDAARATAYPNVPPGDYIHIAVGDSAPANPPAGWLPADDLNCADLSMARGLVREAGGFLLRSDPAAGGLSLRLFLPRHAPPSPASTVARHHTGGRPTILMVEDDEVVRAACVQMLRRLDYQVLDAPDAMEAFRLIADHGGIDLLFTDIGLPGGVSGRALAEAARHVDAGIRVLFTTGHDHIDLPANAGTALLRKPFTAAQLASMVRDVLAAPPSATHPSAAPPSAAHPSATHPPGAHPSGTQPSATQPSATQPSAARSGTVRG